MSKLNRISFVLMILLLLTIQITIPATGFTPHNHRFQSIEIREFTYYKDVYVDVEPSLGGSGLIILVGYTDQYPLITALNKDGTLNWSMAYSIEGYLNTVIMRRGMYGPVDNKVYVGGVVFQPNPAAIFMVVDVYTGFVDEAWLVARPGFEGDEVFDLVVGPGGDIYGVGTVYTGIDPNSPYDPLLFRYDPENKTIIYSIAYNLGDSARAIDVYSDILYITGEYGDDMFILKASYTDGDAFEANRYSHNNSIDMLPRDILVIPEGVYIGGGMVSLSLFLKLNHSLVPEVHFSHTETTYYDLELGVNDTIYAFGTAKRYIVYPNVSTQDLLLEVLPAKPVPGSQADRMLVGGSDMEEAGGLHIDNYGYISGSTYSFINRGFSAGVEGLFTLNMSNLTWQTGCNYNENVTVEITHPIYGNLVKYINTDQLNMTFNHLDVLPIRVEATPIDIEICTAMDKNQPQIIPEFTAIYITAIAAITSMSTYILKKLTKNKGL